MKCQICGKKVNNDSSYGYYSFLVCGPCHEELANHDPNNYFDVMNFIFTCGRIRDKIAARKKES